MRSVNIRFVCSFLRTSRFSATLIEKSVIMAFVFDVSMSCWCVKFAASMRRPLFVTYSLNGCLECVLHWCWHKFCQKLCNFRVYFPCISNVLCIRCRTCEQLLPGRSMPKWFLRKIQLACSEVSFLLPEIKLLLKFDFLLKYEACPIK